MNEHLQHRLARRVLAEGMRRPARSLLLATLVVGTAVFGLTLAVMALSQPLDPRASLAGILAAAALTAALLALVWARRRALGHPDGRQARELGGPAAPAVAVVPLGDGQAAVIFTEGPPRAPAAVDSRRAAEADAEAIWAAVAAATAAVAPPAPPAPGLPGPRLPWTWRPGRRTGPDGPGRDSR